MTSKSQFTTLPSHFLSLLQVLKMVICTRNLEWVHSSKPPSAKITQSNNFFVKLQSEFLKKSPKKQAKP